MSARPFAAGRLHLDEFNLDAKITGEELGHLDVEPDQMTFSIDENERQAISEHADAERTTSCDRVEQRSRRGSRFSTLDKLGRFQESRTARGHERTHCID